MGTPAKATTTTAIKPKQVEYPIYEMEERGKLILPPEIIAQITYLHSHIGKTEWSGMLIYDVVKGNPSKPKDFELEAKHIFLMDIGSAAYTEYEADGDIVDIYDKIPEAMEWKTGHIHTHHNMGAYFSGTDKGELFDNVDKHNYYLSLIVNFDGSYVAKVAFLSDMHTTSKMNYVDDHGAMKYFKQSKVEKHMVVINMRIMYAGLGSFFSDRLVDVKKKIVAAEKAAAAKRKKAGYQYGGYGGGYGGHHNAHFHNQNMEELPRHPIDSKVIPDKMTSWEIEKLTKNVLMFDTDLKTEGNVYAILHQIKNSTEAELELYYDYLISHIEQVIDAYFDTPLDNDEYILILNEVIMCIKKYEGLPALNELIENIEESFETIILGYEIDPLEDTSDDGTNRSERELAERDMNEELLKMESELHD